MSKLNFDLGQKWESGYGCCAPTSCCPEKDEKHYPSFHYDGKEKLDVPDEGIMVIRYKKTSSSMSENDRTGKRYSCSIEVREVVSVDSGEVEAPSKRSREAEDALDKLMNEKKEKSKDY